MSFAATKTITRKTAHLGGAAGVRAI
ncbi:MULTISPECIES: hypothetical protein [unclassified Caulobacter]|nr:MULTISPECIES: hypothetical protein [unclassified Caulobacter]AZS23293.1 hypothetical protein CSW63_02630 [Caulobacter sp. FWC26]MCA0357930.1 hypothetical protein [Pseudomonadota bacterium]